MESRDGLYHEMGLRKYGRISIATFFVFGQLDNATRPVSLVLPETSLMGQFSRMLVVSMTIVIAVVVTGLTIAAKSEQGECRAGRGRQS